MRYRKCKPLSGQLEPCRQRQNMANARVTNAPPFEGKFLTRCAVILVSCFLAGTLPVSAEEAFAPNLCVLPIKNSTVEAARALAKPGDRFIDNYPASMTLAQSVVMLPGVSKPILYPWFAGNHTWTVSEDNTFEALQGPFPNSRLWDRFAIEMDTGRVVGTHEDGVYAFDQGKGQFELIVRAFSRQRGDEVVSPTEFYRIHTIVHIARLGMTLVGTENGVFQLIGESVRPLAGAGKREVGPVATIIDLPVHRAVMLAGGNGDMAGGGPGAMLRHDDGSVERLASISKGPVGSGDYIITASESRQPGRIIIRAAKTLLEIDMQPSRAGFSPVGASTLMSSAGNLDLKELKTKSGEYLILGRKVGWFGQRGLERLEKDGLHTVPGVPVDTSGRESHGVRELAGLGLVLIGSKDRLYSYDGKQVALFPADDSDPTGRSGIAADLSSIGKFILTTERGLFELKAAGTLEQLSLPFDYGSDVYLKITVSEFPAAHVGLIATKDNLYAFSPSGVVQPIRGGNYDEYIDPFAGEIPGRNVMLVLGKNNLHLIATGAHCQNSSE